ncbi:uncharacterized protein LOC125426613 [Sphaerodactylus townsendi]|uniref:uncharacterized protein LOC125426613 n=1 Tax=Sphaerodactylus townsendi TaxID=933632 RepID=UPI002025F7AB|nr:uncharacterized protein LOC125426613 [Sphaerodactylus townsendi]
MATRRNTTESKNTKPGMNQTTSTPKKAQNDSKIEQMLNSVLSLQTETKEQLNKFQTDTNKKFEIIEQEFQYIKKELKDNATQFKKIEEAFSQMNSALHENAEHTEELEEAVGKIKDQQGKDTAQLALLELKQKETFIRVRGLPEATNENLLQRILPLLNEAWQMDNDESVKEIDRVYRVNSRIARAKNIPRDIVFNCVRKSLRDEFLRYYSANKPQLDGVTLIFLKEIPSFFRKKRRDYTELADTLRLNGIRFRWNIPEGLAFQFNSKNYNITSTAKAQDFLTKKRTI